VRGNGADGRRGKNVRWVGTRKEGCWTYEGNSKTRGVKKKTREGSTDDIVTAENFEGEKHGRGFPSFGKGHGRAPPKNLLKICSLLDGWNDARPCDGGTTTIGNKRKLEKKGTRGRKNIAQEKMERGREEQNILSKNSRGRE